MRVPWKILLHQIETSEARDFVDKEDKLPFFSDLVDVRHEVVMAMKGSTLGVSKLWGVMRALRSIRVTLDSITKAIHTYPLLNEYGRRLKAFPELESELFRSLDDEETIADKATPDLEKYRHNMREKNYQIQERSRRLARKYGTSGLLTDSTFTIRNNRYVLPFSSGAMGHEKVIIQSTSESGLTFYGEPLELVELNNELQRAFQLVRNEEERILHMLSAKVGTIGNELVKSIEICGYLDYIFAKGYLSRDLKGVEPRFNPKLLDLKNVRHPLIKKSVVVPISVTFGEERKGLVITGPNAGGKTVSLKTIGLAALMAQSGLHIPSDEGSSVPIFQSVLAEIGDAQSIDLDLSSFGAHILFLKNVISAVNEKIKIENDEELSLSGHQKDVYGELDDDEDRELIARKEFSPYDVLGSAELADRFIEVESFHDDDLKPLILIDEIGRSTDPEEGSAIALALIDRLVANDAFFAITTHLPALKNLIMHESSPVTGAAMGFDTETMTPTYSIEKESVGASYALVIAEKMGLDLTLLEGAKERMKDRYRLLEIDIPRLEKKRDELRGVVEEWERVRSSAQREELREISRLLTLKRMGIEYLLDSIEKSETHVHETMKKSDNLLELARRGKKVRQEFDRKRTELSILKKEIEGALSALERLGGIDEEKSEKSGMRVFEKGQHVWVAVMNREGIIEEVRKDGKRLVVIIDGKKMEVASEHASPIKAESVKKTEPKVSVELGPRRKTSLWLDLHGERVEAALEKVEEFLNDSFLDGRAVVHIIHGIGSGKLRKAIREFLRKHPLVKNFRDGDASEGALGTTVVEFKMRE
jgi:DNA mismatch repair protein MutS2